MSKAPLHVQLRSTAAGEASTDGRSTLETSCSDSPHQLVVSGFEAFGLDRRNPSGEIASCLEAVLLANRTVRITGIVLPVEFGVADSQLLPKYLPTARMFVALGLDSRRRSPGLAVEARANNHSLATPIDVAGPAFWSLAVDDLVARLVADGIRAHISHDAGSYVCNDTFARLLRANLLVPAYFIHIPRVRELGQPGDECCEPLSHLLDEVLRMLGVLAETIDESLVKSC